MSNFFKNTTAPADDAGGSEREYLRAHEVARKLGISRDLVLQHLRNKVLPGFKLGKVWLVRASELEKYLSLKEALFDSQNSD